MEFDATIGLVDADTTSGADTPPGLEGVTPPAFWLAAKPAAHGTAGLI